MNKLERSGYGIARSKPKQVPEWVYQVGLVLLVLFCLAYCADNVFGFTDIAHAAAIQPIHDNAYYCELVRSGEAVQGATAKEIKSVCAN